MLNSLYHTKWPVDSGGRGENLFYRVVSIDLYTLLKVTKTFGGCRLILPPRGRDKIMKSKSWPHVLIPVENEAELLKISCPVPEEYTIILAWELKKQWFKRASGVGMTEDAEKKFGKEIRAKLIRLLTSTRWVDEPDDSRLVFLNGWLENFDLGRCSYLQFSSIQSEDALDQRNKFRYIQNSELGKDYEPKRRVHEPTEEVIPVKAVVVEPVEKPELTEVISDDPDVLSSWEQYKRDNGLV